ncbi:alpha/beta fold hydrolase [Allosaccharopolyspora coralli]|uniref:Alpha/beta fold hydrolase n=1 Tax=Allosaccharopolyspora coralli TaxID=2665642 RepID=A0A5Q3QCL5_9PSEU|nr:alpha/beta fold hydrolase [Allosaccharopolyspora coralli]
MVGFVLAGAMLWPREDEAAPTPPPPRHALIDVVDGPSRGERVQIDATLYSPVETPAPAVLLTHGFGGDKNSLADQARELAARGFTVLTYSARGFGRSTGKIALNAPEYEVTDARQIVDWLARQPEVRRDGDNDPRIGVGGASYGGALSLLLAGSDPRVDAVAGMTTYNDLGQALLPNAASSRPIPARTPAHGSFGPNGVFKQSWAGLLFAAGAHGNGASPPGNGPRQGAGAGPSTAQPPTPRPPRPDTQTSTCGQFTEAVCAAYVEIAQNGAPGPRAQALLDRVSPQRVADRITAPTLLVQGTRDTLFGLDQADANARQIAASGTKTKVVWFSGGHDGAAPGPQVRHRIGDWFAFHLGGVPPVPDPGTSFEYEVNGPPRRNSDGSVRTVTAPTYPGIGGAERSARFTLPLSGDLARVVNPPGGSPAATSSLPGVGAGEDSPEQLGRALAMEVPGQVATFRTEPLTSQLVVSGAPQTRLAISAVPGEPNTGQAVLFAKLYDVAPDGTKTLTGNNVAPIRVTGIPQDGTPVEVNVALPGVVQSVEAGHRLELAVSTTDQAFATPEEAAVHRVGLAGPNAVSVPAVRGATAATHTVPLVPLAVIGGLLLLLLLVGALGRLLARWPARGDKALAGTPLALSDVSKWYGRRAAAVNDMSLRVERGQVVGLLGPNGAGKSTTLRMLLGLVRPTSGEIRMFGHKVRPGAPVLSRVGALVEGPGFLPHLSGVDNLRSYWAATGRPLLQARIDEALDIAELGPAARRPVRTYSQGMRQRLAIAQAMLGLPELLVLDEPTNGLDPAQIHQMRELLRRYAATGRTVVVSSHLLSEIEKICTHVVVMHEGRLVTAGSVEDVVTVDGGATFRVDEPERAADTLRSIEGLGTVETDGNLVHADLAGHTPAVAVNALVATGIAVNQVGPRHRLEDAFLQLVGEEQR